MTHLGAFTLPQLSTFFAIVMALLVIRVRMRAANQPTSLRKIMIPPFAMMTGFLMFVYPGAQVPITYVPAAVAVGLLFSLPLIWTSHMEVRDGSIYLKRSRAFIFILLGLLLLRIALHNVVENYVTVAQTGGLFFILAFSMILPWRIAMVRRYRMVEKQLAGSLDTNR